ncbi:hypothetical protein CDAR_447541 [Caerostris darwini]|uniref:SP-RING-type domain-containing protein n=1 Tax=Caerostris darwini TaxID=1538125 RepID=A0AAV4PU03_9ARAC|nr:hypothetical protein CDAR_447541 [Caerostris darwini]
MSKELIKQPCRGVMCQHPEVFDAVSFLDKMQYHLNWRCPICQKELMYRDLLLETYFREVCDNRSLVYAFWNKRETTKLPDMTSSGEISLVSEIITLE